MNLLFRGLAYWLVTLGALLCGDYYRANEVTKLWPGPQILYAFVLLPPYVVYVVGWYENSPEPKVEGEREMSSLSGQGCRSASALEWWSCPSPDGRQGCWSLLWATISPAPSWAISVSWLVLHYYFAAALLVFYFRKPEILHRVRFETFTPLLIVSFAFFVGATLRTPAFSAWLYAIPASVFVLYFLLHYAERHLWDRSVEICRGFDRDVPAAPLLALIGQRAVGKFMAHWASMLVVAFALGLYLSLFELWRATALSAGRGLSGEDREAQIARYFNATLVSHAVALLLLPLTFVIGSFGLLFLSFSRSCTPEPALVVWYRAGEPARIEALRAWRSGWKLLKLIFGFAVFAIVASDVAVSTAVPDLYPAKVSGISASLFVAVLLAFLATPMVHYLGAKATARTAPYMT